MDLFRLYYTQNPAAMVDGGSFDAYDHRELQNQRICLKSSAGQTLDDYIVLDLTVILLADSVIMIQRDDFFIVNSERCPVHIYICFRKQYFLTVCICRSLDNLINHANGEFSALFSLEIPPCTADIEFFSISGILPILANSFQLFCDRKSVFTTKIMLYQKFQLWVMPMQKQHIFKCIIGNGFVNSMIREWYQIQFDKKHSPPYKFPCKAGCVVVFSCTARSMFRYL